MSESSRKYILAYGLLGATLVIWASAFSGLQFVLAEIDPYSLSALRLLIAAATFTLVGVVVRIPLPRRRDLPLIAATGLIGFTAFHSFLNFGMSFDGVRAGQGSFIISTTPIWTTILAWRFLDEHATYRTWIGLAFGLAGVGWLSLDPEQFAISIGSVVVLAAALCNGGQLVLQKHLLERYEALHVAIYLCVSGTLPMLAYLPWLIEPASDLSVAAWWVTLYLGVVPIALGYFLNATVLSILEASRMAQGLLLIPPLATLIAWWTIGEVPSTRLYIGGPLILAGVLLGQLDRSRD